MAANKKHIVRLRVAPIPPNMHPVYNTHRRKARAQAVQAHHKKKLPFTRYTDASPYPAHATNVVDTHGNYLTAAAVLTTPVESAEEQATALEATTQAEYRLSVRPV